MEKKKTRFEIFSEEVIKASNALGLSDIRKTIYNRVPEESQATVEDGMQACFFYRHDQRCAEIFFNPDSEDDPRYDAWHEMAELSLVDIKIFCRECVKQKKFNSDKWEELAHSMVNRIVSATKPELLHVISPNKK